MFTEIPLKKTVIFSEKETIQVENRYKKWKFTYKVYCLIKIDGINVMPLSAIVHKLQLHNYFAA